MLEIKAKDFSTVFTCNSGKSETLKGFSNKRDFINFMDNERICEFKRKDESISYDPINPFENTRIKVDVLAGDVLYTKLYKGPDVDFVDDALGKTYSLVRRHYQFYETAKGEIIPIETKYQR